MTQTPNNPQGKNNQTPTLEDRLPYMIPAAVVAVASYWGPEAKSFAAGAYHKAKNYLAETFNSLSSKQKKLSVLHQLQQQLALQHTL